MNDHPSPPAHEIAIERSVISSSYLEREVVIDVYRPHHLPEQPSLLLINDGQDLPKMPFEEMMAYLIANKAMEPIVCVGIHCGDERRREYGIAYSKDYQGYGNKAGLYQKFVFDELLPFIRKQQHLPVFRDKSFAGFSLGALSAIDIVWNNAVEFKNVGVFSGSLWWRRKGYDEGYNNETDRLMHLQVLHNTNFYPWLKYFFECGTQDETLDRNNNGVIDSIDDTLDLIMELKSKGYTDEHIRYLEIEGGHHDVPTWARAFPEFLTWAFPLLEHPAH